MTILAWQSNPVALVVPGAPSAWEFRPRSLVFNGVVEIAVGFTGSYQGAVVQPYSFEGFSINFFGAYQGAGALTPINATNPKAEPTLHLGTAISGFGGAYSNASVIAWTSATTSQANPVSANFVIATADAQGNITESSVVTPFASLTPPTPPATAPNGNWSTLQAHSLGDGVVVLSALTTNAQNVEQIDYEFFNGAGTVLGGPYTYSDPSWTAGNTYAWGFSRQYSNSTAYAIMTETRTGSGASQVASLHVTQATTAGATTSLWSRATALQSFDSIDWQSNSTNTFDLFDVSGPTSAGYKHELLFLNGSTGVPSSGGTLVESYSGTVTQVAKILGLGSNIGAWLEYWVDGNGLTLQEITVVSGALQVSAPVRIAGANSTADVTLLGDGRAEVDWKVVTGASGVAGSSAVNEFQIFDFRTAALNGPGTPVAGQIAGTPFSDVITNQSGSYAINGGLGVNVYSATAYASSQATITHNTDGSVTLVLPDGADKLWNMQSIAFSDKTVAGTHLASAVHDLDGTNTSDIQFRNAAGVAYLWRMNGATIVDGTSNTIQVGTNWQIKGVADFNGDGKSDLLWVYNNAANASDGLNGVSYVSFENGAAATGGGVVQQLGNVWQLVGVGDFNGDSMADTLYRNTSTGQTYLDIMNGSSVNWASSGFTSQQVTDAKWQVAGVADFNGDGDADVLWRYNNASNAADPLNGTLYEWQMNGTSVTSAGLLSQQAGVAWQVAGTGDFNGDGKSDILFRNSTNGITYIDFMNGTNVLGSSAPTQWQIDNSWAVASIGDFNGDGMSDILFQQNSTGNTYIWQMNGANVTSGALTSSQAGTGWTVQNGVLIG